MKANILSISVFGILLFISACKVDNDDNPDVSQPGDINLDMIPITGGTFSMGNTGTAEDFGGEQIVHSVTISYNYYMGKYEVTQEQYEAIMGKNPSLSKDPKMPVKGVDWFEAIEFCNKLSDLLGYQKCYYGSGSDIECDFDANGFRLPTEAEWEYACKAGTQTDFYSGNMTGNGYSEESALNGAGWYMHNAMEIQQVGQKAPNAFGLFDMHGNVSELCWDWYSEDYYNNSPETDPTGPSSGTEKVERGGRAGIQAYWCRSSVRNKINPETGFLGFRVVRTAN
jgi:formylglycine-generating enzyme required for sulfatase activity